MKDDALYVAQILDALTKIEKFASGVTLDAFCRNQEKQSAIILQLAIIGELSKHLSDRFKTRVNLPWREIAGFRDRAVHDYFSLDLAEVWRTVEQDIPALKQTFEKYKTSRI